MEGVKGREGYKDGRGQKEDKEKYRRGLNEEKSKVEKG
jgi:hypothetical protein